MDGLSAAASIIAVLQLTTTVVGYLNDVKNASKDQKRFAIEASNLLALLTKLKCCLEESAPTDSLHTRARQLATKNGILDQYKAALERLVAKVVPKGGIGKVATAILWSFDKKEAEEILRIIERLKLLLLIDFQMDHFKLSQAMREETKLISGAVRQSQDDELSKAITNWLSPIDFFARQTDLTSQQQEGTGMWFLESGEFSNWVKGVNTTLFCPGIPGAGKTLISSLVINHLRKTKAEAGVVFLYCNYKENKERELIHLLSALLKQLVQQLPYIPAIVQTLYKTHKKDKTQPSLNDISTTIRRVVEEYTTVFVVVDALDECPDEYRDALISELKSIQAPRIRLMVTSRPIRSISDRFEDALRLPIEAHGEDIKRLVEGQISRLARFISDREDLKQRVISAIHDAVVADGIFLLAQLILDSLVNKVTPKSVRSALESLPRGSEALSQTYEDAVERIKSQAPERRDLAKTALSWIIYAKRPLSVKELQHALAIEIGECRLDEDNIAHISDIVSACAGLVTIDGQSDVVRLIHYTAQEYFDKTWSSISPDAHERIAMACISYLSFDAFEAGPCRDEDKFKARLGSHALYDYAARNWGYHARAASREEDERTLKFLKNDMKVSASWELIVCSLRSYGYAAWSVPRQVTGMHLAAYFGLTDTITTLLKIGNGQLSRDTDGRTPLFYAAINGQDVVIRQLLATNGVYQEHKDKFGQTLLSYAAKSGREAIVKLLLARDDVDTDSRSENGQTPLSYAAENGHEAVVKLLLAEDRINVNSKDNTNQTPLSHASWGHKEVVVKLLLEKGGVEPDIKDHEGRTPLSLAAQSGQDVIVKLLLSTKSVNPDLQDKEGRTPLSYAAETGSLAVVKLLLAKPGVNPDSGDRGRRTPLSWAVAPKWADVTGQNESVVQVLLADSRINPDYRDSNGRTPLSHAVAHGQEEIVKRLLTDDRIDPNSKDATGRTPLSYAAEKGRLAVVKLLLATGRIDPDPRDWEYGDTPLSKAAKEGHEPVVRLLLTKSVSLASRNNDNQTPLWLAACNGHKGIVKMLLTRNRDDLNTQDSKYGDTPLSIAAFNGYTAVVELLLAQDGIDIDFKNAKDGRTPLSSAAGNGYADVVKLLLEKGGVDLDSRDDEYLTPLSLAIRNQQWEVASLITFYPKALPQGTV